MQHKPERKGPRPLWLHLNAGAAMLAAASAQQKDMGKAAADILREAMEGVNLYHKSPFVPFRRPMVSVCESKGSRLITSAEWQSAGKDYVVLIPSLINTWHIFDIENEHSFAAYLANAGVQPVIVDWAMPENDGGQSDMTAYITGHLAPLLRQLQGKGAIRGLAGYCMGGTLIAGLASACPDVMEGIDKTVLIAGPWGFDYQTPDQYVRLQSVGAQALSMAQASNGIVPVDWVQSLFWAIDPLQVLKKFRKFRAMDQDGDTACRFVRVEDWLNDGREVSAPVAATCLHDWYGTGLPAKGQWKIDNIAVNPADIPGDVMIACGSKDNLVPPQSARAIRATLPGAAYLEADTGHIGLMASNEAPAKLWNAVAEFFKQA